MPKEQIKIVKLGRKQQPSKFKPGETYSITTILDDKDRKMAGFGPWTENWKIGDTIEAEVEEKKWTDKDGLEQKGLNLKNPNQKPFIPNKSNQTLTLYQIAASLAPLFYKNKDKVKLEDIDKLVEALKTRVSQDTNTQNTQKDSTPSVNIDEEDKSEEKESKNETKIEDDEDEPF